MKEEPRSVMYMYQLHTRNINIIYYNVYQIKIKRSSDGWAREGRKGKCMKKSGKMSYVHVPTSQRISTLWLHTTNKLKAQDNDSNSVAKPKDDSPLYSEGHRCCPPSPQSHLASCVHWGAGTHWGVCARLSAVQPTHVPHPCASMCSTHPDFACSLCFGSLWPLISLSHHCICILFMPCPFVFAAHCGHRQEEYFWWRRK